MRARHLFVVLSSFAALAGCPGSLVRFGADGEELTDAGLGDGQTDASCANGEVMCSGSCVDLNTSAAHCGNCEMACSPGLVCSGSKCGCVEGEPCGGDGGGGTCNAGSCVSGCTIDGVYYQDGALDPQGACKTCQPTTSTTSWTNSADGTSCGPAEVCAQGACGDGCDIGGQIYAAAAPNPTTPATSTTLCQSCLPALSTTAWSSDANGTSCGAGEVCNTGVCATGCFIDGLIEATGNPNPNNACQTCQPTVSTSAWTNVADNTSCGNAQTCAAGVCGTQCVIGGMTYASNAANPSNACQICQPGSSTSAWTTLADGTTCGGSGVCSMATCLMTNCYEILAANNTLPSGTYTIALGNTVPITTLSVYCDMTTDGGGWTEVYDQVMTATTGYAPVAEWTQIGGLNPTMPNQGLYSILFALPMLKSATNYELRLVWPSPPNSGYVSWQQSASPLSSGTDPGLVTSTLVESPTGQNAGSQPFIGLRASSCTQYGTALTGDGDNASRCNFEWSVGSAGAYMGAGIPSYGTAQGNGGGPHGDVGTPHATLWVR